MEDFNGRAQDKSRTQHLISSATSVSTSPVTDLARNLDGLLSNGTPRRRISWSSSGEDTPELITTNLSKSRLFLGGRTANSPQLSGNENSPMFQNRLLRDVAPDNCHNSGRTAVRRVRTMPNASSFYEKENIPRCQANIPKASRTSPSPSKVLMPRADVSPHLMPSCTSSLSDFDSRDSGCFLHEQQQQSSVKIFPPPLLPVPRRAILSPLKCFGNQQQPLARLNSDDSALGYSSSERSSVSASADEVDDGFLDGFDSDAMDSDAPSMLGDLMLPKDFMRLLRDPLSSESDEAFQLSSDQCNADKNEQVSTGPYQGTESPKRLPIRRCLSMIEESPVARPFSSSREKLLRSVDQNNNCGVRRPEDFTRKRLLQDEGEHAFKKPCDPPPGEHRPLDKLNRHELKRRKSIKYLTKSPSDSLVLPSPRVPLQRCHSETDAAIASALMKSAHNPNLIGDCSATYTLPLVSGKHHDLKSISCTTLSNLIQGEFKDKIEEYEIVDCRYPYEFDGGHIKGACNIYTKESIMEKLIEHQPTPSDDRAHKILVFHCEFSSERGPNLCRFLRNMDREANKNNYPKLFHPEIYLLEGGYRDFFQHHKNLCIPQDYLPMLSKDHEGDLKKFRSKSKSWSGDTKSRNAVRPGLKL